MRTSAHLPHRVQVVLPARRPTCCLRIPAFACARRTHLRAGAPLPAALCHLRAPALLRVQCRMPAPLRTPYPRYALRRPSCCLCCCVPRRTPAATCWTFCTGRCAPRRHRTWMISLPPAPAHALLPPTRYCLPMPAPACTTHAPLPARPTPPHALHRRVPPPPLYRHATRLPYTHLTLRLPRLDGGSSLWQLLSVAAVSNFAFYSVAAARLPPPTYTGI